MYNDNSTVSLGEWKGIKSAARGGLLKSLMIGQSPSPPAPVAELVLFVARRFISARFAALLNTGNNTCFLAGVEAWGHPCSPTLAADQCLSGKA